MKQSFLFLFASLASAASHDWAIVERLKPGTQVIVDTTRGSRYDGNVHSVAANEILVTVHDPGLSLVVRRVSRPDVRRIRGKRSRFTTGLIGALAGGAGGAGLGAALDHQGASDEDRGVLTVTFGMLGAAIGFGIGAKRQLTYTIYEAPLP